MSAMDPEQSAVVDDVAALRQQVRELELQLSRAQRLATVGTMAAMVAHEFNNILTPVLNYAQMASDGDPIMQAKAIRFSLQGARRATAISRALLALTNPAAEELEEVNLADLVSQVLDAMARDLSKDGITLVLKVPAKLKIRTRPGELAQVLLNLLINARAAVLEKGRGQQISLEAKRSGGEIVLRVADTGVGIPPENLQKIFQPFFTTKQGNGSGLGLAVCRHVVDSMNGRLLVRSEVGKGTCFTVALPAEKPSKAKLSPRSRSAAASAM